LQPGRILISTSRQAPPAPAVFFVHVEQYELRRGDISQVFETTRLVGGREHVPRTAVYQNVSKGIIPDLDVHRYDHGSSRDHSQTGRDPLRTIPAHDSHVVPSLHTDPAQTKREKPHPPGELAI
jgi:hypothetical protein